MSATHGALRAFLMTSVVAVLVAGCTPPSGETDTGLGAQPSKSSAAPAPDPGFPMSAIKSLKLSYWKQAASGDAGKELPYSVGISNDSDFTIQTNGDDSLQVYATWHKPGTIDQVGAPIVKPLHAAIGSHSRGGEEFTLTAPTVPGPYLLKIQLATPKGAPLEPSGLAPLLYNVTIN